MGNRWSGSDKLAIALACLGAALAIILFLVEKTPTTMGAMVASIAALLIYPIHRFFVLWKTRFAATVVMLIFVSIFGCIVWPKKVQLTTSPTKEQAPVNVSPLGSSGSSEVASPTFSPPVKLAVKPNFKRPDRNRPSQVAVKANAINSIANKTEGHINGSDNTLVGNTGIHSIDGNGNTIVGPTDLNGNTILNQGGTTIGAGACGCPTCVVVGAHAGEAICHLPPTTHKPDSPNPQ